METTTFKSLESKKIKNTHYKSSIRNFLSFKKPSTNILPEDIEILNTLEDLKKDLEYVHNCLDYITDPILIDSYIYQIQALNMRYKFYIRLCKNKGLIADIL